MGKMSMIHQEILELLENGMPYPQIVDTIQARYNVSIEVATNFVRQVFDDPVLSNDYYDDDLDN
jgi:hypothetical protein